MKIIFLDFDGVLNHKQFFARLSPGRVAVDEQFDPTCISRLNRIVERTGAKVVISSTWRVIHPLPKLRSLLRRFGFRGEVIGATPDNLRKRGHQIQEWLDGFGGSDEHRGAEHRGVEHRGAEHPNVERLEVESFVILDDDADMVHLMHALVRTSFETGLTDELAEEAIKKLNRGGA